MTIGVHSAKPVDADAGVALSRVEVGVAEHLGDVSDVGPTFETEGGDTVAQQVAAAALVDAGQGEVPADLATEPVRTER